MREIHSVIGNQVSEGLHNRVIIGKGLSHPHEHDISQVLSLF